jgi:hypothetical protein
VKFWWAERLINFTLHSIIKACSMTQSIGDLSDGDMGLEEWSDAGGNGGACDDGSDGGGVGANRSHPTEMDGGRTGGVHP